jgi:MFS family permease
MRRPPPLSSLQQSLALILPAIFLFSTLETWLFPALPMIQTAIGATTAEVSWVFTGLLLVGAVSTPVVGRLADVHGKHALFFWVLVLVCIGILCSALATGIVQLAIGQALQGVGLSLVPLSIGIIRENAGSHGGAIANGLVIGAATASTSAGLLFAGPMVARFPYQALFWLPLAGLVACAGFAFRLRQRQMPAYGNQALDWQGAVLLSSAILSLLLGITMIATDGWRSFAVLGCFALTSTLMAVWVGVEKRAPFPFLELSTLRRREVWSTCGAAFFLGFGSIAGYVIVPPMAQMPANGGIGFGATVAETGLFLLPLGLLGTVAAPLAAPLERWIRAGGVLFLGCAMIVLGLAAIGLCHSQVGPVVAGMACIGVGIGLALTQVMNFAARASNSSDAASLAAIVYLSRSLGGALGAQVAGTVLQAHMHLHLTDAFTNTFMLCALVSAMSLLFCACLPAKFAYARHPS